MSLLYEELTDKILGACLEVYNQLGCGFLEAVYSDALEVEFELMNIPYKREKDYCITYKGKRFSKYYKVDFLCFDKIIIEIKAVESILPIHKQQVFNYLRLSDLKLGFVINFGSTSLQWQRVPNLYTKTVNPSNP